MFPNINISVSLTYTFTIIYFSLKKIEKKVIVEYEIENVEGETKES